MIRIEQNNRRSGFLFTSLLLIYSCTKDDSHVSSKLLAKICLASIFEFCIETEYYSWVEKFSIIFENGCCLIPT